MRTPTAAVALLSILVSSLVAPIVETEAAPLAFRGLTFADDESRRIFDGYVEFLGKDPARFERHLATIRQLQASEVHYHLVITGQAVDGIEGHVTSDGRSVFIHVTHVGGPNGEVASMNSRLAHEFEHARQFDSGEIAFVRDPVSGRWGPLVAAYDIGDDVKAWEAQLEASVNTDFFIGARGTGVLIPSVLRQFADAVGFEDRASVLKANGYKDLRPIANANVRFTAKAQLEAGTVVHPGMRKNFFGRVHGDRTELTGSTMNGTVARIPSSVDVGDSEWEADIRK
ncbi:MAG: hypothetical protein IPF82_19030 [Blastocatellia bacterium]|nr:hypothetical protein [Blastocatellia bacterium]